MYYLLNFRKLCLRLKNAGLKDRRVLKLPSMVLLQQSKLKQDFDYRVMQVNFALGSTATVHSIFLEVCMFQFVTGNRIPRLWTKPNLSDEEKDQCFEQIANQDPFYKKLLKKFKDPLEKGREGVGLCIDSTKIPIQSSRDFHWQKSTYYGPKNENFITMTNITSFDGSIVHFGQVSLQKLTFFAVRF